MIISDEFWRIIKNLKQEILNLKQVKKANCASKYYVYTISSQTYYNNWLITYKAGDQPIIAEAFSYADTSMSAPSNNQQYVFSFSQVITDITILSTREIDSVVGVS